MKEIVSLVAAFIIAISATFGFGFVAEYIFTGNDISLVTTTLFGVFAGMRIKHLSVLIHEMFFE